MPLWKRLNGIALTKYMNQEGRAVMAERFAGALTLAEQDTLERSYFLPQEIETFNKAISIDGVQQDLNFKAANFQRMITNRIAWVERLKKMGWSKEAVATRIKMYYDNKRSIRSSFDLLQSEASPSARQRGETDNSLARRLLKLTRIRANFGYSYTQMEQHNLPQSKKIPPPPK
jgi:hypothetical protein